MAGPLTWRNVDVPQLSTRDLQQSGEGITNGFDRLAAHFSQRDERLNEQALGEWQGRAAAAQSPEEFAALRAELVNAGSRVNRGKAGAAINEGHAGWQGREAGRYELLGHEGQLLHGQDLMQGLGQSTQGNFSEADAHFARMQGTDAGRYFAGMNAKDIGGSYGTGTTHNLTRSQQAETASDNRARQANARAQTANSAKQLSLAQGRENREAADWNRLEATRKREEEAADYSRTFTPNYVQKRDPNKVGTTAEAELTYLQKTPAFQRLSPERQKAVEADLGKAYGTRFGLTEEDTEKRTPEGANILRAQAEAARQIDRNRTESYRADETYHMRRVGEENKAKWENLGEPELIKTAKERGVPFAEKFVKDELAAGSSPVAIMSSMQVKYGKGDGFIEALTSSPANFILPYAGANVPYRMLMGGRDELQTANANLRNYSDLTYQERISEFEDEQAPYTEASRKLETLNRRAEILQATGDGNSPVIAKELEGIREQMRKHIETQKEKARVKASNR
ncbi:MAG: hypothetical protein ACOH2T_19325 [Pseudomonas sp.]